MPEIIAEVKAICQHPVLDKISVERPNLVGRKALLRTLKSNIEVRIDGVVWFWDGVCLTMETTGGSTKCSIAEKIFYKAVPRQDATVEITSIDQYDANVVKLI
jgi:hypothetical protein